MQETSFKIIDKLPIRYKEALNYVIEESKKIYKENLLSIFLAGSGGKGNIIEGWSDLDLYFITNDFDIEANSKLFSKVKDNEFNIHIGTTFYTLDMITKLKVDSKTLVAFYEYKNLNCNSFIYNRLEIKDIKFEDIICNNKEINDLIQIVGREIYIYKFNKNNFKTLIKKMTLLVKVFLIKKYNKFVYGYNDVFNALNILENIDINIDIEKIIERKVISGIELKCFSDIINIIMEGI